MTKGFCNSNLLKSMLKTNYSGSCDFYLVVRDSKVYAFIVFSHLCLLGPRLTLKVDTAKENDESVAPVVFGAAFTRKISN